MKKISLIVATLAIAGLSVADIQAPPGAKNGIIRKFSRGIANIVYGATELPSQWHRSTQIEGGSDEVAYGTVLGTHKTIFRVFYGLYDVVTFPFPTYKGGYKAPYVVKQDKNVDRGYSEFPPELGFSGAADYTRLQDF